MAWKSSNSPSNSHGRFWSRSSLLVQSTIAAVLFALPAMANPVTGPRQDPTIVEMTIAVVSAIALAIPVLRCPRDLWKRFPYSAFVILGWVYALLGWILGVYNLRWFIWLAVILGSFLISLVSSIELGMIGFRALILAAIAAAVNLFASPPINGIARACAIALVLGGGGLWSVGGARFRLDAAGIDRSKALRSILTVSSIGLWFGWVLDTFVIPTWGDFVTLILSL